MTSNMMRKSMCPPKTRHPNVIIQYPENTMGKNRHSKDKMYITATEWSQEYGGKKTAREAASRPLPFDHCALGLTPFHTPVLLGTKSGVIFDFEAIVPYVQEHNADPVSGDAASTKDIIRLHMTKNADGEWECPITSKVFTNASHVVAIATSGNVYAYGAVSELNIKAKNFTDLISGEPFKKSDILTLQDPQNAEQMAKRDINNFSHLKTVREESSESRKGESKIRQTLSTSNVMKEIESQRALEKESGVKRKTLEEIISNKGSEDNSDVDRFLALDPLTLDVTPGQVNTDGRASSSLTSTSSNLWTSNATRRATAEEIREARWKIMRQVGKKGYAQLQTTHGNLNVELHCDIAPRTAWNFLTLCERGYFDDMALHRLVPGFMVQAGDPTGTGAGGSSAFGGRPFRDEFDTRILHDTKGVLSMANSGMNTNGSQFFMLFAPAKHLDLKHAVFGRVVGGLNTLDRIEEVGADKKEKPLAEVKIVKAMVFTNPIPEADDLLEAFIRSNMKKRVTDSKHKSIPSTGSGSNSALQLPDAGNSKIRKIA